MSVLDGHQSDKSVVESRSKYARPQAGKGFAVVAGEVRTLANNATAATEKIKSIIEGSTRAAELGVKAVERAGRSFSSISDRIQKSSASADQMADDAQAQSISIQEIQAAMLELDQTTHGNAAMVDASAELSKGLNQEATSLNRLLGEFILQETGLSDLVRAA